MGEEDSEGRGRVSVEVAVSAGRPSRHQPLTGLGVCSVARPRCRGSWPRPGPHPSSFQPPSGDARSTCNCLSHACLQRRGPSPTGSWEAESPGTHPGSCPAAAQVRPVSWSSVARGAGSMLALTTLLPGRPWWGLPEHCPFMQFPRHVHLARMVVLRWRGGSGRSRERLILPGSRVRGGILGPFLCH